MAPLEELDPRGHWFQHERPFRHVRARHVFREDTYAALKREFVAVRDGGPANAEEEARFAKRQPGYDALMVAMDKRLASRFAPLFERRWISFLAQLLHLPTLPQVDGGLHHVPVNSRSGWVHNDFCSAWFDEGGAGEVVLPDRRKCDYFSGSPKSADARPREYVRAATMIFYIENDGWQRDSGGETGLYSSSRADLGAMVPVPPVSNSLLLFECSPHSYHRLLANPGCARNSIILWLHDNVGNAQARWGGAVTRRKPQ
jgi:2OG-Fe(II) oxygenase superfamily